MISERAILEAAIAGFEQQKRTIDETISALKAQLNGGTSSPGSKSAASALPTEPKTKRTMSAAARKRIQAAQKARWAAFHAAQKTDTPKSAVKAAAKKAPPKVTPKRKMSAAVKAKLVANLAKARAAKAAKAVA